MTQPDYTQGTTRTITVSCFICQKASEVQLFPWQSEKKVVCPICLRKEAIVGTTFFTE